MPEQIEDKGAIKGLIAKLMLPGRRDGFAELVRSANAARDAGRWRDAAEQYEAALQIRPDDASILVQLGHMRKESGDLEGAEDSYLRALALNPRDQDLLVQLGHFYKLFGDHDRALQHYRRALDHGSADPHARHYVEQETGALPAAQPQRAADLVQAPRAAVVDPALVPACYLDLTDLIAYFKLNRSPTGVQRVEIELLKAALTWRSPIPIAFCACIPETGVWIKIDARALQAVCELSQQPGSPLDPNWRSAVDKFLLTLAQERPFDMQRGAALINLGPWWQIDYSLFLRHAKNTYGIRYVPVIYDFVPLVTPEYVPKLMPADFSHWLSDTLMQADALACISHWTQRDLVKAVQSVNPSLPSPIVMPLDARFGDAAEPPTPGERRQALDAFSLTSGGFVLFVATLEARKNHLLAVQAWIQLIEQHGADAVPPLVCAGRQGWRFEQTQTLLDSHPDLAEKVILLSQVSDVELKTLYLECLFTVYTSTYEGWGLPVTESLCHGKPCLTLEHSSLPEAGGKFADYSAASPTAFAEAAWRLIDDTPYRRGREQLIAKQFRPRTWQAVLAGLIDGVAAQLQALPPPAPMPAAVVFGAIYETRHNPALRQASRHQALTSMLRHGLGWHRLEPWGVWAAARSSALMFRLPDLDGATDSLLLYLEVEAPVEAVTLTVKFGLTPLVTVRLKATESRQLRLRVPFAMVRAVTASGGAAMVTLNADHLTDLHLHFPGDARKVSLGLRSFALCLETDIEARLRMIERCQSRSGSPREH